MESFLLSLMENEDSDLAKRRQRHFSLGIDFISKSRSRKSERSGLLEASHLNVKLNTQSSHNLTFEKM